MIFNLKIEHSVTSENILQEKKHRQHFTICYIDVVLIAVLPLALSFFSYHLIFHKRSHYFLQNVRKYKLTFLLAHYIASNRRSKLADIILSSNKCKKKNNNNNEKKNLYAAVESLK